MAKSQAEKFQIWDMCPMIYPGYLRQDLIHLRWHWIMHPLLELLGTELVYEVGLETLGYPPTWAETPEELNQIDSAIAEHLKGKY